MTKRPIPAWIILSCSLVLSSCNVNDILVASGTGPTDSPLNEKVVMGLKTALQVGIDSSATAASKVNGYLTHKVIKILLPEEAAQALQAARDVAAQVRPFADQLASMQNLVDISSGVNGSAFTSNLNSSSSVLAEIAGLSTLSDSLIFYMNRAAEYAAPRSVPIFKNAITDLSIDDGLTLLNGSDSTGATLYLEGKTLDNLETAYTPIVDSTLALVPLTQYWGRFRTNYNDILTRYNGFLAFQQSWNGNVFVASVPALQVTALKTLSYQPIVTESLGAWTTSKALHGLFFLVGEEEKGIRRDPIGYIRNLATDISDLLREVFGQIMQMETKP